MSQSVTWIILPPEVDLPLPSETLRDAARLGLQSALAAAATVLVLSAVGIEERFLGIISSVLVLDPSRDATIGNAAQRIVATIVGTVIGGLSLLVVPGDQLFSLGGAMLVMGALALIKPDWRYGLVAAAGLAYGHENAVWDVALDRAVTIFTGAGLGIAAGFLVLPKSARSYALAHLVAALQTCSDLLDRSIQAAIEPAERNFSELHNRFSTRIKRAASAASSVRLSGDGCKLALQRAIHQTERLWHALIILDRVSEAQDANPLTDSDKSAKVRKLQVQCCEALACIETFKRPPDVLLDDINKGCAALYEDFGFDQGDAIQQLGLVYGMHEVARNIRELAEGVPQLRRF